VYGVLMDPNYLGHQTISNGDTIHTAIDQLWEAVTKRVDEKPTKEKPHLIQILLGGIDPFTPFGVLNCFQRRSYLKFQN
jgi:hypothetical protein